MRTKKQIEKKRERTQWANIMLSWMQRNLPDHGSSVMKQIIEPYHAEKGLELFECWRAFNILKETGRVKTFSGGRFHVEEFDAVTFLEDGSIK
jgi:hypothetical protein